LRGGSADIRRALRPDTALISIMHANELGTLQPIAKSRIAPGRALFHADGVQALGKTPVVQALGVVLYHQRAQDLRAKGRPLRARDDSIRSCSARAVA
jgi:cysteine sulfinate desulfinase/cysteine desulfurase-like protein